MLYHSVSNLFLVAFYFCFSAQSPFSHNHSSSIANNTSLQNPTTPRRPRKPYVISSNSATAKLRSIEQKKAVFNHPPIISTHLLYIDPRPSVKDFHHISTTIKPRAHSRGHGESLLIFTTVSAAHRLSLTKPPTCCARLCRYVRASHFPESTPRQHGSCPALPEDFTVCPPLKTGKGIGWIWTSLRTVFQYFIALIRRNHASPYIAFSICFSTMCNLFYYGASFSSSSRPLSC